MAISNPTVVNNARTTTSNTIGAITLDSSYDGALLAFAVILNSAATINILSGWTREVTGSSPQGRSAALFWRRYETGDNFPPVPTYSSSTQSSLILAAFWDYDPDQPIELAALGAAGGVLSHQAAALTPTVDGAAAAWWWGACQGGQVQNRRVTRPAETINPRAEPTGTTASGTGAGVQMDFGVLFDCPAGQSALAGAATTPASPVGWRSAGMVVRPAPGKVVTGQFLPFFGP